MTQQEIYETNQRLSYIMLRPLLLLSKKRNGKINEYGERITISSRQKGHNLKKKRPCYVCKTVHLKSDMTKDEYFSTRLESSGWHKVKNIVYRCKECQSKYKPRREYISGR
jgi:hypothetical protein